jgi:hypothetical protein
MLDVHLLAHVGCLRVSTQLHNYWFISPLTTPTWVSSVTGEGALPYTVADDEKTATI